MPNAMYHNRGILANQICCETERVNFALVNVREVLAINRISTKDLVQYQQQGKKFVTTCSPLQQPFLLF